MNNKYMDVVDKYLKDEKFLARIINLVSVTTKFLSEQKIDHFLVQGTLLGYKKYKSIMPWETDIDISIISDKQTFDNNQLKSFINTHNLEHEWKYNDTMIILKYKDQKYPCVDLCLMRKRNDRYCRDKYCYEKPPPRWFVDDLPSDYLYPLQKNTMNGIEIFIPNKTNEILDIIYPDYQNIIILDPFYGKTTERLTITKDMTAFHYLTGIAIGMSRYYSLGFNKS